MRKGNKNDILLSVSNTVKERFPVLPVLYNQKRKRNIDNVARNIVIEFEFMKMYSITSSLLAFSLVRKNYQVL